MGKIVASVWFQVAVVPLMLMLIGVFAKRLGRRDGDKSHRINDWAVGTTILLMLLGIILGDLRTVQGRMIELLAWLIILLLMAFIRWTMTGSGPGNAMRRGRLGMKNVFGPVSSCLICCASGSSASIRLGRLM